MEDQSTHRRALILALAVTVLWSSSWILIRWGLDDHGLRPLGFAGLRYALAALVLGGWVVSRPATRTALKTLSLPQIGRLAGLGLVFYTLTQGAQFVAIDNQPAATTSLILSMTPLVMTAVSARTLGEPPTRAQVVGAVVIFAGALLYFSGELGFTAVGMVAAVVALASNSTATLLGRSVNRGTGLPAEVVTVVSMGVGAAVLLGTGIVVEGAPRLTGTGWLIVGWLAVVNTALAFSWWNWSLRHLSAPASAGINNTMLIQIALLAWVFLGEVPGPVQWVGMAAVTVGVALAQRRAVAVSRARSIRAAREFQRPERS